LIKIQLD